MLGSSGEDPDVLLKEATARKDAGDLSGAIGLLREAYRAIKNIPTIYPVNTFLRLPLYLQQAKRNDEAWREFNSLLTHGYPNQTKSPGLLAMDHAIIYKKMRLFLQREGKSDLAVRFGILSYLSKAIGLHRQRRKDELTEYISRDAIQKTVSKLLKKAGKDSLVEQVVSEVQKRTVALPSFDIAAFTERIDRIVAS